MARKRATRIKPIIECESRFFGLPAADASSCMMRLGKSKRGEAFGHFCLIRASVSHTDCALKEDGDVYLLKAANIRYGYLSSRISAS
jgi:hypothetical protein